MIINKKSWHYKYISFVTGSDPKNLCQYIRRFCLATVLYAVWLIVMDTAGAGMGESFFNLSPTEAIIAGLPIMTIAATILFGVWYLGVMGCNKLNDIRQTRKAKLEFSRVVYGAPITKKEPGVFSQYFKDKHDKVCSTIEYKE